MLKRVAATFHCASYRDCATANCSRLLEALTRGPRVGHRVSVRDLLRPACSVVHSPTNASSTAQLGQDCQASEIKKVANGLLVPIMK